MMVMPPPNRVMPGAPPEAYTSWQVASPLSTHHRPASCAEFGCSAREKGWTTRLDESKHMAQRWGYFIRTGKRAFVESTDSAGLTVFRFQAGQSCFHDGRDKAGLAYLGLTPHLVRVDRQELYLRHHGDWRKQSLEHKYDRPDQFVDDMSTHAERVQSVKDRG